MRHLKQQMLENERMHRDIRDTRLDLSVSTNCEAGLVILTAEMTRDKQGHRGQKTKKKKEKSEKL